MRLIVILLFLLVLTPLEINFLTELISQAKAEDLLKEGFQKAAVLREVKEGIRIMILTSGPAEYTSHWIDSPPSLIIEFQSKDVYSRIDNEVGLNQGMIKKITSRYYGKEKNSPLKSLSFEFSEKVPYEIRQKNKAIFIDIKASAVLSPAQSIRKEIVSQDERKAEITKRLEEMDKALRRIEDTSAQEIKSEGLDALQMVVDKDSLPKVHPVRDKTSEVSVPVDIKNFSNAVKNPAKGNLLPETKIFSPIVSSVKSKGIPAGVFLPHTRAMVWGLLSGLALFSGLGILIIRYLRNKSRTIALVRDKWKAQFDSELEKIKLELKEKEKRLNQEEIIRRAIEQAQVQKEKDYSILKSSFESLQLELKRKNEILAQKEAVIGEKEQTNLQKEQECAEFKKIIEALKSALVKRKIMGKSLSSQEDDKPWIPGESAERREFGRLDLSRDYHRSVLLRIDSQDKSKTAKCFAGNISLGGLYFESEAEFQEKEILRLRLFFFGDKVPMMRVKAEVVWVKKLPPNNHYGLSLLFQEEKNKAELKEYIESHMAE